MMRHTDTVLGVAVAAALALTSCAGSPGGDADPSPSSPAAGTTTGAPSTSTPGAAVSSSPSASTPAAETTAPTDGPREDPLSGPTQTYTTRSGIFTWTLPEDWTVKVEDDDELGDVDTTDLTGGIPYEVVEFSHPQDTVTFTAITGLGPTDNDGWKPEVLEIIEAAELSGIPVADDRPEGGGGTGPVYMQTAITQVVEPPGHEGVEGFDPGEDGDYGLSLQVANLSDGADPMEPEDFYASWYYYVDPPQGAGDDVYGTANIFSGGVDQDEAEEITGLTGEDAVRAVLDTPEYAALRAVMTSVEVRLP